MGKLAPEAAEELISSLVLLGLMCPIADRRTDSLGKNILLPDAQKHVFKTPVYNVHLCIIIFFSRSRSSGIAVL